MSPVLHVRAAEGAGPAAVGEDGGAPRSLARLRQRHRACRRCVDAGHLDRARPVFSVRDGQRVMVVGQAPGPVEADQGRPFAGRAGRQLMRWMIRAGFRDEEDVRARVAFMSATTCFPGRRPGGAGDRRPGAHEVALCAPWLDAAMDLLRPRLVLAVGSLAVVRLFGTARPLEDVVGRVLLPDGSGAPERPGREARLIVPLPHPSGQSRWLNAPGRAALLDDALSRIAGLVQWAEGRSGGERTGRVLSSAAL